MAVIVEAVEIREIMVEEVDGKQHFLPDVLPFWHYLAP